MDDTQIVIKGGEKWFAFSKSRTGQLDFLGAIQDAGRVDVEGYRKIASSAYFSPSRWLFLQDGMNVLPEIYVSPDADISDRDTYEFLLHVGPLLCAVEEDDPALAGELYWRRRNSFGKFPQLTRFIIKPLAVEILFALVFGRMSNVAEDEIPLVFQEAKKRLGPGCAHETLEQAFVRHFKENDVALTLPVVGTGFHHWNPHSAILGHLEENVRADDLSAQLAKIGRAKRELYAGLETAVQAEPYNPADENAIAVMIENVDAKLSGNPGMEKAGYIRATAAKIIRAAKPEKLSYDGKLARLSERDIVVSLAV